MTAIFDILCEGRPYNTFTFYVFRPDFHVVMKKGTIITSPNCFAECFGALSGLLKELLLSRKIVFIVSNNVLSLY